MQITSSAKNSVTVCETLCLSFHRNHQEDLSAAAVLTLNSVAFSFFSVEQISHFFSALCFVLQLHINYAGEHQSQPVHGY